MNPLNQLLHNSPVATLLIVIIAIAGAVVTITHPATLPFDQYVKYLTTGGGLLAIGRGVRHHGQPPK